jgi:hypothetical protein
MEPLDDRRVEEVLERVQGYCNTCGHPTEEHSQIIRTEHGVRVAYITCHRFVAESRGVSIVCCCVKKIG